MASRDYNLSKLYVGNLPLETTETMFADHLASCPELDMGRVVKISVKKGYGFVECMDQVTSDMIIDKFHEAPFYGAVVSIEPAVPAKLGGRELPVRVVFSTTEPQDITEEDVQDILSKWGGETTSVQRRADVTGIHGGSVAFIVTLAKGQTGEELVSKFNETTTKSGVHMKVKIVGRPPRSNNAERSFDPKASRSRSFSKVASQEFPLRILVPSEMVGAIIGKGGATIKDLTMTCDARVDILKAQPIRHFHGSDMAEKIVTILGIPENATKTCKRILEILVEDVSNTKTNSEADISLRILAYNSLIGRVIGKGGANIRKIMEDTLTKIQVSNQTEYQTTYWQGFKDSDRIITIRGSIEGMSQAEALVTAKLRTAFDADVLSKVQRVVPATAFDGRLGVGFQFPDDMLLARTPVSYGWLAPSDYPHSLKSEVTTTYLYVPPQTVGCLIGAKGATIKEMNRASGATIKIEKVTDGSGDSNPEEDAHADRRVTIVGPGECHTRAQWLIFERLRSSGLIQSAGELKFTVEMMVPSRYVGRLIGKAGGRIQELQQQTLTTIKFVPYKYSADIVASRSGAGDCAYTLARIHGTAFHVLAAESRIRNHVYDFFLRSGKYGGGRGGYGQVGVAGAAVAGAPGNVFYVSPSPPQRLGALTTAVAM